MNGEGNDRARLINAAIEASIEFEELMDKTDFDSWLNVDTPETLKNMGQLVDPFTNYKDNEKKLKEICYQMKREVINNSSNSVVNSSLEEDPISKLFYSKHKRLDARICSDKEDEEKEYNNALYILLSALNDLQNLERDNKDNMCLILLYNDLSICYAGLGKSSMSRGYAEEAREIIEKEKSYKEFGKKLSANNSTNQKDIKDHDFVSSKLFKLYTIALFNQAEAERRSSLYTEAERNFKRIIKYGAENTCLINFNHYSAILYLSLLYIDQGRGKEAIELLEEVINKSNEADIRYWKAFIAKSQALIDQSEYDEAKGLLFNKFLEEQEYSYVLNKEHRVTSQGFKGLNYFTSCQIEKVRNTLNDSDKGGQLNKVKNLMEENIINFKKRKQKGFETKAYKHLSEIYTLLKIDTTAMEYFIKYLSNGDIDELKNFVSDPKMEDWIDECNDLDFLERFIEEICKFLKRNGEYLNKMYSRKILKKLEEKIKRECEDKDQLFRAARIVKKIKEVLGEEKSIKYKKSIFPEDSSRDEDNLTKKEIITRLDINEKGFDSVLFERSNLKKDDHIVEMVVLRRWNSFSPGLYRESTGSLGGGYLLRINKTLLKKGDEEEDRVDNKIAENKVQMSKESSDKKKIENIVIDPGYNFLQNFRSEGFRVEDIDTIIVTHSHLDHCAELLPIMDLIFQFNKRYESTPNGERDKKKVNLCLSRGAYTKFSSYTNDPDWQKQLKDVIILEDLHKKKWTPFEGLTISAIQTPHMDLGGVNAIGLMIEIDGIVGENEENSKTVRLGFTGDTPWYSEIIEDFCECDLLCVHLGSIKYQEIGYTDDRYYLKGEDKREIPEGKREEKFEETYTESNHLLFFGTEDIISHYDKTKEDSLIIVGEFGEELKYGLRTDLCKKLSMGKSIQCLPGDIGQYIVIEKGGTKKVRCNFCEEFVGQKEIRTCSYGREDAIHYICQTCNNTLSKLQKQAIIEHRVTRH